MIAIPDNIKNLVEDLNWNEVFIFEEIPCNHKPDAKKFEKVDCPKCLFDERESWLEEELIKQDPKEVLNLKPLSKIVVIRGRYNDCIGIQKEF